MIGIIHAFNICMKKILIIDDDEMSLKSLSRVLEEWDFKAEAYSSPILIPDDISIQDFYCAIVDYKLNDLDGVKVINELKLRNTKLLSVLISGFDIDKSFLNKIKMTVNYFLEKPIKINLLKKILISNLEEK